MPSSLDNLQYGSTIYIAGPMRGHHCYNFEKFFYYAHILKSSGYEVINPAEMDCLRMFDGWRFNESDYEEVLAIDLAEITANADALFVLEGWEKSEGANREIELATNLGLPVYYEEHRR